MGYLKKCERNTKEAKPTLKRGVRNKNLRTAGEEK
jgi:hypothetical protein